MFQLYNREAEGVPPGTDLTPFLVWEGDYDAMMAYLRQAGDPTGATFVIAYTPALLWRVLYQPEQLFV